MSGVGTDWAEHFGVAVKCVEYQKSDTEIIGELVYNE